MTIKLEKGSIPTISVIIPTYDCSTYITEAIESVLKQSFICVEIIVVDDGSSDSTLDVLRPYINKNLIQYIYQKNGGVSSARNTGIRNARGKYLAFLDADDIMLPGSLKKRTSFLNTWKDIKFVFSDYLVETEETMVMNRSYTGHRNILNNFENVIKGQQGNFYFFNKDYTKQSLKCSIFPWTGTVMFHKSCLDKAGFFNEKLRISEDEDLWLRIANQYSIGYIDQPLAVHKKSRRQATSDKDRYYRDLIEYLEHESDGKMAQDDHAILIAIRKRLSRSYYELAYYHMNRNKLRMARIFFLKSFKNDRKNVKLLLYLILSYLPEKIVSILRKIKIRIQREEMQFTKVFPNQNSRCP